MSIYFYTAVSFSGEQISGTESAANERELSRILHEKGYVLTSAEIPESKHGSFGLGNFLGGFSRVSLMEKLVFIRNLKIMISAGVPLPKALEILSLQAKGKRFRKTIENMKEKIMRGHMLSQAMEAEGRIFPEFFTSMMRVGEESGTLEQVLSYLTLQMEREYDLKSKVKGALMYPVVVIIAMAGVGVLMLVTVVPNLAKTFEELKVELPLTTRLVIGLGTFLSEKWYLAPIIIIFFVFFFYRMVEAKAGKRIVGSLVLKIPVISGIVKKTNAAVTVRTLSSLISAGVPIVRSLEITSNVLGNIHFRNALRTAADEVRKGFKLSQSLKRYEHLYSLLIVQMLQVGEETGQTGEILSKLADFFEEEVSSLTKNLASLLEPILMLIIGAVVGFFAISMIQPMYSMLGAIQ